MDETSPKLFVFVLMPFSEEFDDIYQLGIKAACVEAGAYCERVDEQNFDESILQRVYNQIAKADVVVADMTHRNPNVFYETGYAHALNKRVVLLTQKTDDIPFDLKHYPHIIYDGKISLLRTQLKSRLRWCIDNPKESLTKVDVNLEILINGESLVGKPEIPVYTGTNYPLRINIHNLSNRLLDSNSYSLSLTMPEEYTGTGMPVSSKTRLQNGLCICNLDFNQRLFPDEWFNIEVPVFIPSRNLTQAYVGVVLRLHTEFGPKDYLFALIPK